MFYSGEIARSIVDAVNNSSTGGILTMNDLSSYEARLGNPVYVDLNGECTICSDTKSCGLTVYIHSTQITRSFALFL